MPEVIRRRNRPDRQPAECSRRENSFVSAAMTTSMIEQIDHSNITPPAITCVLWDCLPELRMRRIANTMSNTGTTTLITPKIAEANKCSPRPSAPSTRNHSDPQKNTARMIMTKHNPSRRYAGSYSPTLTLRTAEPNARGTHSNALCQNGSAPWFRAPPRELCAEPDARGPRPAAGGGTGGPALR